MLAVNISSTTLNDEQFLDFVVAELARADSPRRPVLRTHGDRGHDQPGRGDALHPRAASPWLPVLAGRLGSGLSSFIFLKNLPVDFLKLDGQFMHNVTHDPIDRSMVEAIAQIGESMNIRTIAERVDSADVLARLADIGIQYAQGHYISAPQPVAALETLVAVESPGLRRLA